MYKNCRHTRRLHPHFAPPQHSTRTPLVLLSSETQTPHLYRSHGRRHGSGQGERRGEQRAAAPRRPHRLKSLRDGTKSHNETLTATALEGLSASSVCSQGTRAVAACAVQRQQRCCRAACVALGRGARGGGEEQKEEVRSFQLEAFHVFLRSVGICCACCLRLPRALAPPSGSAAAAAATRAAAAWVAALRLRRGPFFVCLSFFLLFLFVPFPPRPVSFAPAAPRRLARIRRHRHCTKATRCGGAGQRQNETKGFLLFSTDEDPSHGGALRSPLVPLLPPPCRLLCPFQPSTRAHGIAHAFRPPGLWSRSERRSRRDVPVHQDGPLVQVCHLQAQRRPHRDCRAGEGREGRVL